MGKTERLQSRLMVEGPQVRLMVEGPHHQFERPQWRLMVEGPHHKLERPQWRLMVEGPHQQLERPQSRLMVERFIRAYQAYKDLSKIWIRRTTRADPHSLYCRCQTHPKRSRARLKGMALRMLRMRSPNQTKSLHNPMKGRLPLPSSRAATAFTLSLRLTWTMLRLKARRKSSAASGSPETSRP